MAFVAEDGTGLSTSNGFITDTFFTTYHTDRGRALLDSDGVAYTTPAIQAAIVLASDFIEAKFVFVGIRKTTLQAMEWPRVDAYYKDSRVALGVPIEVQECVAELALKVLEGVELAPDPTFDDGLRPIVSLSEQVGPIKVSTEYADGGGYLEFKPYPFAEKRMKELIITGSFVERI